MFRCTRRPLPRFLFSCLFALGLLAGGLATPALAAPASPARTTSPRLALVGPNAGPATLLIHGVGNAQDHILGGCDGDHTWGPTKTFLSQRGWTNVYSLGYYSGDYNCGPDPSNQTDPVNNLYYFEQTFHTCTSYYDSGSADGTWNEDDRHVACELAWYIWEYYTLVNNSVNIVAHSLGGVLLKEALYQIYVKHDNHFPPYLYVHQVVTFESPLDGIQEFADEACNECEQLLQLEWGVINNIWGDLNDSASKTVRASGGTNWTMEGDADKKCNTLGFAVGGSAFGMDYGVKISYNAYVPGVNSSMQDACSDNGGKNYYYGHGTYLVDTQTLIEVSVKYCINCAGESPGTTGYFAHSLQEMAWGLSGRCYILASTTTCDGTDPTQTGCSSDKTPLGGDPWYLTMYWSTHCSTNWALVYAPSGDLVTVTIARSPTKSWSNVDRQFIYCAPSRTSCPLGTWATFGPYTTGWITDILYAPNEAVAVRITTTTGNTYTSIWH